MRISVPTVSTPFLDLLSPEQTDIMTKCAEQKMFLTLLLHNKGNQSLFVEKFNPATDEDGFQIFDGGVFSIEQGEFENTHFKSEGVQNEDVRIIFN